MATPGRALPAAQPQTEFTTTITVPLRATASSTASVVRSSSKPRLVSSSRMGATKNSGYISVWTPFDRRPTAAIS